MAQIRLRGTAFHIFLTCFLAGKTFQQRSKSLIVRGQAQSALIIEVRAAQNPKIFGQWTKRCYKASCNAFPTLFNLAAHKDARVADVWGSSREDGGWSPVFLRPFNDWELEEVERFLHFIHTKKIRTGQEDRLLLKESITDGFSVRRMYHKLMFTPPLDFPSRSIWNPIVPPKLGFFTWEASWGKVFTLDQLKKRGIPLVNRCFLCEENEETIDHLLIHCLRAKEL